ncbi:MAG TPA: hypothetical protein PK711_09180 [Bacteroidales bacterium]|nr:hypothetical protein [Bacteroidales bacterium]HRZ22067.1 hypothetical protein [Bacteroidales bacterium]
MKSRSLAIILVLMAAALTGTAENIEKIIRNLSVTQQSLPPLILRRTNEPRENAFSLLIPKDWKIDGGIFRVDPTAQGGAGQSIEAKLDLTVKKDDGGTVMVRWLPDMLYFDMRQSMVAGYFPQGSNYNGMMVWPMLNPRDFILTIAFPYAHPHASNVQVIAQKQQSGLAAQYSRMRLGQIPGSDFHHDAIVLTLTYQENGISYKETFVTLIEDYGQMGAGLWGNHETYLMRAPIDDFDDWAPVCSVIMGSVKPDPNWVNREIQGQIYRGQLVVKTQQDIQRIEQEIVNHRQQTFSEIQNDMFLNLTGQEEYVNPFTKETEIGSNQWNYRWENPSGEIIYTNQQSYNPNQDVILNRSDYKLTPVRPR